MNIFPLDKYSHIFPNPLDACDEGLLAYGGDLNPNRVIKAYSCGIFPWFNEDDPVLWWSPNPRCILQLDEFKVSKSLEKTINKNIFEVKFNHNFSQIINECAKIRKENNQKTWITPEVIDCYIKIHELGFAHSFESYYNGQLVGGGYGLSIGDMFCGESMFAKQTDASKVAFYYLVKRLKQKGFKLIDCQIPSKHLESFGAKRISREKFLTILENSLHNPKDF